MKPKDPLVASRFLTTRGVKAFFERLRKENVVYYLTIFFNLAGEKGKDNSLVFLYLALTP